MADLIYASTKDADMLYAIKRDVSDPVFWIRSGDSSYVFLDSREFGMFKDGGASEPVLLEPLVKLARAEGFEGAAGLAEFLLARFAPEERTVMVPKTFPIHLADHLRKKGYLLEVRQPFFSARAVKSAAEAEVIRGVAMRTGVAFRRIEEVLEGSAIKGREVVWQGKVLTSEILKAEAEIALIRAGLADVEGMIISCEAHSAIPHHRGEGPIFANEAIVCDIFPRDRQSGYHADITRTYVKGEPKPELQKMYDAVALAQTRAIQAVRPGVPASDIDAAARQVLAELGYQEGFTHSTGHGVGLEVHEAPSVGMNSKDVLEPGNVITIEPGLYYPEHGGIRIEDMVLVTETSGELLSQHPKRFVIE